MSGALGDLKQLGKGSAALEELHPSNAAAVCLTAVAEWFTGEPWRHFGLLASRIALPREEETLN